MLVRVARKTACGPMWGVATHHGGHVRVAVAKTNGYVGVGGGLCGVLANLLIPSHTQYWQCKELTNGQCPNNAPLCRLSAARVAAQESTPYVTEAEARARSARAQAQAIQEHQQQEAAGNGDVNVSG